VQVHGQSDAIVELNVKRMAMYFLRNIKGCTGFSSCSFLCDGFIVIKLRCAKKELKIYTEVVSVGPDSILKVMIDLM
jgi:hypothetical protein